MVILRSLNTASSKLPLCDDRLSIITISPSLRTGSSDFVMYSPNMSLLTGPSKTMHCVVPSRRTEESMVVVFHEPGADPKHLSPFLALPRKGTILVWTADSSMNTRRLISQVRAQFSHSIRVFFISSRSCSLARNVFFYK